MAYLFGRGKEALAQCEEFTRFFFEVFEVFAVQFSSWAKHLPFLHLPESGQDRKVNIPDLTPFTLQKRLRCYVLNPDLSEQHWG
jgi:hypothetical protein